jgi:hypothetical protein
MISHEISTKTTLERGGICPSHFSLATISHYASLQQRNNNAQRIHLGGPDQNTAHRCTLFNKMELESPMKEKWIADRNITILAKTSLSQHVITICKN